MATQHPPELKAAVLAELATGGSVMGTARKFGVPRGTVQVWSREIVTYSADQQAKKEALGELVYNYLTESIRTLELQVRFFGTQAWLEKQPAGELAILHGVLVDKSVRLLEAARPAAIGESSEDTDIE